MLTILLALLCQVPADVKRAEAKLTQSPEDPTANLTVGLHLIQKGDPAGIPHLLKSSDPDVKNAAQEEEKALKEGAGLNWSATGEAWLIAAKKLKKPALQEHAVRCFDEAWGKLDGADRGFLRLRLLKVAAPPDAYQQAPASSGSPQGWYPLEMGFGASVERRFARSGKASIKLLPAKTDASKNPDGWSSAETQKILVTAGKKYVASCYVFALDTDQLGEFSLSFRDASGGKLTKPGIEIPSDRPLWKKIEIRCEAPASATGVLLRVDLKFSKGALWVDDVSLLDEAGTELFQNGGLER